MPTSSVPRLRALKEASEARTPTAAERLPARHVRFPPRGWRDFAWQLGLWLGFGFVYEVARGLADRGADEALANARRLISAERELGVDVESALQHAVLDVGPLLDAVNWTYWLAQFTVLGLALLWIYVFRTDAFFSVRNSIFAANVVGLIGYVAMPTAPPRLVPDAGILDTLAARAAVNHETHLVELAANPYAAMPSLHAADALLIGAALARLVRVRVLKLLWTLWPAWVAFALVATGNHFLLDIVVGVLIALVGTALVRRVVLERPRR